jgi:hypothetical protein
MTLTRWWLAGVMALTVGVGGVRAQTCSGPGAPCATAPGTAKPTGAVRAPYYNEVADILFPSCASAAATQTERLWDAIRSKANPDDPTRMHVLAARYYLATGHYATAEFYARLACRNDPNCRAAQYLLAMSVAQRYTHHNADDGHEACEAPAAAPCVPCVPAGVCEGCKDCATCREKGCCEQAPPQRIVSVPMMWVWAGAATPASAPQTCVKPVSATTIKVIHGMPVPARQVVLTTGDQAIRLVCGHFKASCDQLRYVSADCVLLQGRVTIDFKMADHPSRVVAGRVLLNLRDGSYEVNPVAVRPSQPQTTPTVRPASFSQE